jgi:sec-independent protein translocase protein TatB
MFDIGLPEFMVLALVAIFVFGPDKLPEVARQAGRLVRQARTLANSARDQLADELGPEFRDLDLRDLTPRNLVQKHILNGLDDDDDDDSARLPGHAPLEAGEVPPYDVDAT